VRIPLTSLEAIRFLTRGDPVFAQNDGTNDPLTEKLSHNIGRARGTIIDEGAIETGGGGDPQAGTRVRRSRGSASGQLILVEITDVGR